MEITLRKCLHDWAHRVVRQRLILLWMLILGYTWGGTCSAFTTQCFHYFTIMSAPTCYPTLLKMLIKPLLFGMQCLT